MFGKILVPLDGSSTAEMVIPYAEEIAAKHDNELVLVSVSKPVPSDMERQYQTYLEGIREQVQHQLNDWEPHPEVQVQIKVLMGNPADEILRYANEVNAGLIAMTSRGSSVPGPWLLGNIAAKVLRATTKPLLLVRAPANNIAFQQKRIIKRILLPLDDSKLGEAAIPYAEVLCQTLEAELVLFQVLDPIDIRWLSDPNIFYPTPPDQEVRKSCSMDYLNGVGKPLRESGLKASCEVAWGSPAEQIIDYAKANSIDLIAMSTHGRSGLGRWVFGCVTDKVLHSGDTAVLIVRPQVPEAKSL